MDGKSVLTSSAVGISRMITRLVIMVSSLTGFSSFTIWGLLVVVSSVFSMSVLLSVELESNSSLYNSFLDLASFIGSSSESVSRAEGHVGLLIGVFLWAIFLFRIILRGCSSLGFFRIVRSLISISVDFCFCFWFCWIRQETAKIKMIIREQMSE